MKHRGIIIFLKFMGFFEVINSYGSQSWEKYLEILEKMMSPVSLSMPSVAEDT